MRLESEVWKLYLHIYMYIHICLLYIYNIRYVYVKMYMYIECVKSLVWEYQVRPPKGLVIFPGCNAIA